MAVSPSAVAVMINPHTNLCLRRIFISIIAKHT
jgi:hypothetical protein